MHGLFKNKMSFFSPENVYKNVRCIHVSTNSQPKIVLVLRCTLPTELLIFFSSMPLTLWHNYA